MKTLIIAALLGTVAAGGVAIAQTTATPPAKPITGDANGDGKVSRAEYMREAETRFAEFDANKDGSLTREERPAGRGPGGKRHAPGGMGGPFAPAAGQDTPPPGGAMRGPGRPGGAGGPGGGMARLDTDKDGKVTRAEYDAQSTTRFARMDANRDGTIDAAEMAAMPGGGRMGGRMAGRADTDGNGALTRAEFDGQSAQRFARMDTNGDGVIDATELQVRPTGRGGARRPAPPMAPAPAPTPAAPTGA